MARISSGLARQLVATTPADRRLKACCISLDRFGRTTQQPRDSCVRKVCDYALDVGRSRLSGLVITLCGMPMPAPLCPSKPHVSTDEPLGMCTTRVSHNLARSVNERLDVRSWARVLAEHTWQQGVGCSAPGEVDMDEHRGAGGVLHLRICVTCVCEHRQSPGQRMISSAAERQLSQAAVCLKRVAKNPSVKARSVEAAHSASCVASLGDATAASQEGRGSCSMWSLALGTQGIPAPSTLERKMEAVRIRLVWYIAGRPAIPREPLLFAEACSSDRTHRWMSLAQLSENTSQRNEMPPSV